ncbi:sigma factor-like helix-turn-helix DNA-binding protein [Bacteroides eggerthii]|uniref:Sigma factor-like helix-turn-helix DNA-binding protein n=1 Tax=Bacteroides eggerthii TaxID=28111 RepID=A0ABT7U8J8_9BACE|nr:sigma factor-like helix-turn-helix DNA-binding protein [Bacteroides eggerthii]
MPNIRYRNLIRMRYLEQKSNEETAEALGMSMDNYYNKHKLAKEQYIRIWRKEVKNG